LTLPVIIRPDAERDLGAAASWYDMERVGLGADFLIAVRQALMLIGEHPHMFPIVLRRIRRILLSRFPYGLFYVPEENCVVVLACIHAMRDPKLVRSIVRGRQ
jgi:plasmid stabilization system protein ParE